LQALLTEKLRLFINLESPHAEGKIEVVINKCSTLNKHFEVLLKLKQQKPNLSASKIEGVIEEISSIIVRAKQILTLIRKKKRYARTLLYLYETIVPRMDQPTKELANILEQLKSKDALFSVSLQTVTTTNKYDLSKFDSGTHSSFDCCLLV
jgi:hypothetical protein